MLSRLNKQNWKIPTSVIQSISRRTQSQICGIDLGTTNSAVAIYEGNGPKILVNSEGGRTTPSVVAFINTKDGKTERIVGSPAKRQAMTNAKNTFYATKRLIGRRFDDIEIQKIAKHLSYEVASGDNGDAWVYSPRMNKKYSPSQIGSYILQKMKETAEAYCGAGKVNRAVVTCPAYFNDSQRQATKDAGQIAGLTVERIVNEPTAAALAYGFKEGEKTTKNETIAVYDLGGGTFDISILSLSEGVFEVLATNGDTALGGEDFDHELLTWVSGEFKKSQGIDLMKDLLAVQRLKEISEKAKMELDHSSTTQLQAPFITADSSGPKHLDIELTRAKFESLVSKLVERSIPPCEQCLKDAHINTNEITQVILVGGMTRTPIVQQRVEKFFNKVPNKSVNPDEVVALGAAIQGAVLSGKVNELILVDVTPLSLGIETLGNVFTRLIEKNTAIPCKKSEVFSTAGDNQTQVGIKVYQGEREMAPDNKFLGHFDLVGIAPAPRGRPQIEVTFDIDANGLLNVSAKDKATNKDQSMQISTSGGLSKQDIERMKQEAEQSKVEDKKKRELVELKNSADSHIWQSESQLQEHQSRIPEELKKEVEEKIKLLRQERDRSPLDQEKLKAMISDLNKSVMKIGEKIYSASQGQGSSQGQGQQQSSNESNKNDENTVEGSAREK